MANIKSAKKRARQTIKKHQKNIARKSALKTAVKNVLTAVASHEAIDKAKALLRDAESKLARAKGKRVIHKNTARRKISRLAKKVAHLEREATAK